MESGRTSAVGELYNEIPDRVSDVAILVGLGYAAGGWPTAGWAASVAAVLTAYVRAQIVAAGGPQDFVGPMAKPQRMFLVTVTGLYCWAAPTHWQPTVALPAMIESYRLFSQCLTLSFRSMLATLRVSTPPTLARTSTL